MRAEAKLVHRTKKQFIVDGILYNSENKVIARGTGMFVQSKIRLTEDLGYL